MANSISDVLRPIGDAVVAFAALPIPDPNDGSGGTGFDVDVLYGDESVGRNKNALHGRVVLTIDGADGGGKRVLRQEQDAIFAGVPRFEAHLWAPAARNSQLDRLDAAWLLYVALARAIDYVHHGATEPQGIPITNIDFAREPKAFKHGQAAVATFSVPIPVTKGRVAELLPVGSTIGNLSAAPGGGTANLNVNPE